jgi:DNA-binding transcriptional ArsR family regulator
MLSNSETQIDAAGLARLLRAAADPVRLRLLRLCADGPVGVSELAAALGESEPNVSRHLKQLATEGFLRRARRGQRVEYRAAADASLAQDVLQLLLPRIDVSEPVLREARSQLGLARSRGTGQAASLAAAGKGMHHSRLGRTLLDQMAERLARDVAGRRVLARGPHAELLELLLREAGEVCVFARSVAERAAVQRWADAAGVAVRQALAVDLEAERRQASGFDVVLECIAPADGEAGAALAAAAGFARRMLASPGGVAWQVVSYDALDQASRVAGAPPARLRGVLAAAALECEALLPVEADGQHLLVARARATDSIQYLPKTA